MNTKITVEATIHSSIERAFKTPILGDATQFLIGYGIIPPVAKFTDDNGWGKVGGTRIPHSAKGLLSPGGKIGLDEVYARKENKYWRWGVAEFYQWSLGFNEFRGELFFEEIEKDKVKMTWVYNLISESKIAYPLHWLFGQIFWKGQMKLGIKKMKEYAESDAPFLYE